MLTIAINTRNFRCALDRYILSNLEYISDLMAGKDAHVFKYADRNNLYFDCQISISIKEPKQQCIVSFCVYLKKFKEGVNSRKLGDQAGQKTMLPNAKDMCGPIQAIQNIAY
jgi:hypothetical protein